MTQEDVFGGHRAGTARSVRGASRPDGPTTPPPFPRIPYEEALAQYGTDKPDLRNPWSLGMSPCLPRRRVRRLRGAHRRGDGAVAPCRARSRGSAATELFRASCNAVGAGAGAQPASVMSFFPRARPEALWVKFLDPPRLAELRARTGAGEGDAVFFICDERAAAERFAGRVRNRLGEDLGLVEPDAFRFCWVTDFPMYERNEQTGQIEFSHNPFSMPQGGLEALETRDPLTIKAYQYDIVCNGVELSSGAIRNHRADIMYKAFAVAGYGPEEVEARFGGMLNAFRFGRHLTGVGPRDRPDRHAPRGREQHP